MRFLLGLALALAIQLGLQSAHVWWVLAACRPTLLVVVGAARRRSPSTVGWAGLLVGLLNDIVADRVIGPGGIATALAGVVVATVVIRFELRGPLFWTVGALLAAGVSEIVWMLTIGSLGIVPPHGWPGVLAAVAATVGAGFVVALGERVVRAWTSPERRRRRTLKRL